MKRMVARIAAALAALALSGCGSAPGDKTSEVTDPKLYFDATVLEVREHSVLVEPLEGAEEGNTADQISVGTDSISEESSVGTLAALRPGDTIRIGYHGGITETYPAGIDSAFAIAFADDAAAGQSDLATMVMVDGALYYDTGEESTIDGRCGVMDGEITSAVSASEIPATDDQSNFGTGYGYQYTGEGQIEIYMNEKWMVFEERE